MALSADDLDTLPALQAIVDEAGEIALRYFKTGTQTDAKVTWKGDGSPVTEADFAVNVFLESALRKLWPDAAWLSEESVDDTTRLGARRVIIVDPIDGTRGFARGDRHWCVAVALVEEGRPIVGIVHAPAAGETFTACCGHGALLNGAPVMVDPQDRLHAATRVSAPTILSDAMRKVGLDLDYRPKIASLALRITSVAARTYDCCVATRNSNDWDLAAADLILQEAGGLLTGLDGQPLIYNKADTRHGLLTATGRLLQPLFMAAIVQAETLRHRR